jgi:hypothetical protein
VRGIYQLIYNTGVRAWLPRSRSHKKLTGSSLAVDLRDQVAQETARRWSDARMSKTRRIRRDLFFKLTLS